MAIKKENEFHFYSIRARETMNDRGGTVAAQGSCTYGTGSNTHDV